MKYLKFLMLFFAVINSFAAIAANESKTVSDAFKNGKTSLNLRYRYEFVDQQNLDNANASTLRTAFGFETDEYFGLKAFVEFEDSSAFGSVRFNNGINNKTNYALVKDPDVTEINQAYLLYKDTISNSEIKLGRQELMLNNRRFVGNSPWRNNHRSIDGVLFTNDFIKNFDFTYAYIRNVHDILGRDSAIGTLNDTNINLFNLIYSGLNNYKIITYGYFMDIKDPTASSGTLSTVNSASNKTFGSRIEYKKNINDKLTFAYNFEYAHQTDFASNPNDFSIDYFLAEPILAYNHTKIRAGYEKLGSDGNLPLIITLGNKHGFNGFADKFTTVPSAGLQDFYMVLTHALDLPVKFLENISGHFEYHEFYSAKQDLHYGSEFDFLFIKKLNEQFNLGLKLAQYNAISNTVDTNKIMLFSELKF